MESEYQIQKKIDELSISLIESITSEELKQFKSYNLRYYEDKYCISFNDSKTSNNDILLRFHSNRLILITIAKGHDIFRKQKVIEKINFNVKGANMLNISVSGKKKAGAKRLKKNNILCYLECKDDKVYPIYACVPASLIEVNKYVIENPQLLVSDYKGLGYIGVLYPQCFGPNAASIDTKMNKLSLLSEEEYLDYLKSNLENLDSPEQKVIIDPDT